MKGHKILRCAEDYYGVEIPLRLSTADRRPGRPIGALAARSVLPRHVVAYLCFQHTHMTLGQIGKLLGISPWTVRYAQLKISKLYTEDEVIEEDVDSLRAALGL